MCVICLRTVTCNLLPCKPLSRFLPCCCGKTPIGQILTQERKGWSWFTVGGYSPSWQGSHDSRSLGQLVRKQREVSAGAQLTLALETVPPTVTLAPPTPGSPIWIIAHGCSQRLVSQVTVEPVKWQYQPSHLPIVGSTFLYDFSFYCNKIPYRRKLEEERVHLGSQFVGRHGGRSWRQLVT